MTREEKTKIFREYVQEKKILIVDAATSIRSGLAHILNGLGVKTEQMTLMPSVSLSMDFIASAKPEIILTDYQIESRNGLELLAFQRKMLAERKDTLFVLITANSSETAVADAAEEEVDAYILKPFTTDTVIDYLSIAIANKVNPSEYRKAITRGKKLLEELKWLEAEGEFEKATSLVKVPALAFSYLGDTRSRAKQMQEAELSYDTGLKYNEVHYRCLIGKFDLLFQQERYRESYAILKRATEFFPLSPQRLETALRLCVITKNFEDIDLYYSTFLYLTGRKQEVARHMIAALIVAGRYFLSKNRETQVTPDFFRKAAGLSVRHPVIMEELIQTFMDYGRVEDAADFLKTWLPEHQNTAGYLAMDYAVKDRLLNGSRSVDAGRKLINDGFHHPVIYRILIQRSGEASLKPSVETLVSEASKRWPEKRQLFSDIAHESLKRGHQA